MRKFSIAFQWTMFFNKIESFETNLNVKEKKNWVAATSIRTNENVFSFCLVSLFPSRSRSDRRQISLLNFHFDVLLTAVFIIEDRKYFSIDQQ